MAVVAVSSMVSSTMEFWCKMMGASAFFTPVHSTRFELWESTLESVQIVDLSFLSSSPRGANFFWSRASPSARGSVFPLRVRSSWWMFTLAFGSAFLIWFSTVDTVLCTVNGKMRLDIGHHWSNSLFME